MGVLTTEPCDLLPEALPPGWGGRLGDKGSSKKDPRRNSRLGRKETEGRVPEKVSSRKCQRVTGCIKAAVRSRQGKTEPTIGLSEAEVVQVLSKGSGGSDLTKTDRGCRVRGVELEEDTESDLREHRFVTSCSLRRIGITACSH